MANMPDINDVSEVQSADESENAQALPNPFTAALQQVTVYERREFVAHSAQVGKSKPIGFGQARDAGGSWADVYFVQIQGAYHARGIESGNIAQETRTVYIGIRENGRFFVTSQPDIDENDETETLRANALNPNRDSRINDWYYDLVETQGFGADALRDVLNKLYGREVRYSEISGMSEESIPDTYER